jgi:flagellar biosynthetic protein FlhB
MSDAADRTEKPTPKKLREAREKGQIARSRDLSIAAASLAAVMAAAWFGRYVIVELTNRLAHELAHFGDAPLDDIGGGDLRAMILNNGLLLVMLVGPIAVATMVAGIGITGLQGGWSFSPGALTLNWGRLSPVNGAKRFFGGQAVIDTVKTLITAAALAYISWNTVTALLDDSLRFPWLSPVGAAALGWDHIERLLWQGAWALLLLACADYGLQYYRLMQQLKMSKQDIRDEAKQSEGSAEVKGKVRAIQRQMARQRMMADVPGATVVITNPTHFAVALEYRRDTMVAPKVVAKGRDHVALRIREIARQHGIPIVENKPLAQTLFKTADVGETIPAPLFAAVAEVLAYLVRIRQLVL